MTNYISYLRVSTQRQGQSGLGLEAQQYAISSYKPIRSYVEIESGKKSDRPELLKALADCKKSKSILVIAKIDRLARNVHFLSGLMYYGVDYLRDLHSFPTRRSFDLMAAVAEDEALRISKRTKEALAAYKARGGKLGGARDGAYKIKGGANPVAAKRAGERSTELARDAYSDITPKLVVWKQSGLSDNAIAKRLCDDGYKTRFGKDWNRTQVRRVMSYETLHITLHHRAYRQAIDTDLP